MILARPGGGKGPELGFASSGAIARLQHPNIVQSSKSGHGWTPFFSLEFVGGQPRDMLRGAHPCRTYKPPGWLKGWPGRFRHPLTDHQSSRPQTRHLLVTTDGTPKITVFWPGKCLDADGRDSERAISWAHRVHGAGQAAGRVNCGAGSRCLCARRHPLRVADGPSAVQASRHVETVLQVLVKEPVPPSRLRPNCPARSEPSA